jgi:hypothetical protein
VAVAVVSHLSSSLVALQIVALQEEAHLNMCFKHFYYFVTEFKLVDAKEMAPLQEVRVVLV